MSKKIASRLLVIDANVARAAGETEHPVSSACREFLQAVLKICHHVAMTADLDREWEKHQSRFTRKWRVAMAARRKALQRVKPKTVRITALSSLPDQYRDAIEKDRHLLEAASAADGIIVTLDERFRAALDKSPECRRIRDRFCWINPVTDGVAPLQSGKFDRKGTAR